MKKTLACIWLSPAERATLEGLVSGRNTPQKLVWRARIVLLSAERVGVMTIVRLVGKSKVTVWRWQERYLAKGTAGLRRDATRPGRKPRKTAKGRNSKSETCPAGRRARKSKDGKQKRETRKQKSTARRRSAPPMPRLRRVNFKFLDHPADVGFVAHGKTLPETFAAAAQALCDFGWELRNVQPRQQVEIRARAATLEDLLYSWLSEILFLTDAEQWVFRRFQVHEVREQSEKEKEGTERLTAEAQSARGKSGDESAATDSSPLPNSASSPVAHATGEGLTAWEIRATAQGEKFVPTRHRSRTYIKAVTYHQLSIKKTPRGWQATVFLDV